MKRKSTKKKNTYDWGGGLITNGMDNSKLEQLPVNTEGNNGNTESSGGGGIGAAGIASIGAAAVNDITSVINSTKGIDTSKYQAAQASQMNNTGSASLDELMAQEAASSKLRTNYSGKDLGAKDNASIFKDAFMQSNNSFFAGMGSTGSPLMGGISAAATLGMQSIAGVLKRNKLNSQATRINVGNGIANAVSDLNKVSNAQNIMSNNNQSALANYAAFGGNIFAPGGDTTAPTTPAGLQQVQDAWYSHIINAENASKKGYNAKTNRWSAVRTSKTVDGKVVYTDDKEVAGLEFKNNPKVAALYKKQGYLTDDQVREALQDRMSKDYSKAQGVYDAKYGEGAFSTLPYQAQLVLTDIGYNTGSTTKFTNLMQALHDGDIDKAMKNTRTGNDRRMNIRNNWLAQLQSIDNTPFTPAYRNFEVPFEYRLKPTEDYMPPAKIQGLPPISTLYDIDPTTVGFPQSMEATQQAMSVTPLGEAAAAGGLGNVVPTVELPTTEPSNVNAFGGNVETHGANFPTGLRQFNEGGSHESNPYEGVQIGVDPQGVPNLVEEGETMFGNYVFSNRINVNKSVKNTLKLGGNVKTFADASKYLAKETEEMPNDPIAKATQKKMLERLQEEQEAVKQREAVAQQQAQLQALQEMGITPEMLQQSQMSQEQPQMSPEEQMMQQQMSGQEYAYGGNLFDGITGSSQMTTMTPLRYNPFSYNRAPLNYKIETPNLEFSQPSNPFEVTKENPLNVAPQLQQPFVNINGLSITGDNTKGGNTPETTLTEDDFLDNLSYRPEWLRYAPVGGAAIGLANALRKPDYSRADSITAWLKGNSDSDYMPIEFNPIGNYLQYNPLDRNYYINQLKQQSGATRNAVLNGSNGNRASAVAGLLANGYNTQMSMGNLARQAEEYNQSLREKVETFNRDTNKFNSQMGLEAQKANQSARIQSRQFNKNLGLTATLEAAKMKQAIDDARSASISANLTSLFDNLGAVGTENYSMNQNKILQASDFYGTLSAKPRNWTDSEWERYKKLKIKQAKETEARREKTRAEKQAKQNNKNGK